MTNSLNLVWQSLRAFYRQLGECTAGGSVVDRDGALAAIAPSAANQSIINGVVYEQSAGLIDAYKEIAAAYDRAGVNCWRVWVHPGDDQVRDWLAAAGHELGSTPRAMTFDMSNARLGAPDSLEWERTQDVAVLAALNEGAYGLPPGEFTGAFKAFADYGSIYVAKDGGEPASCLLTVDAGSDCGVYCVATRAASRHQGLATGLIRRALLDAVERGCTTSSLQSSAMGAPVYEGIGFRDLVGIECWSRNRPR